MEIREVSIERKLRKEVNRIGGLCFKFNSGVTGVPDRIVVYEGKTIFVEMKRTTSGIISDKQKYWLKQINARKVRAIVIHTKTQVDEFIQRLLSDD